MTEQEWLTAADPQPMLKYVRGRSSERKLRLFAVACCRQVWHLLADERTRTAVEVAERFADGGAAQEELAAARYAAAYAGMAAGLASFSAYQATLTAAAHDAVYAGWDAATANFAADAAAFATTDPAARAAAEQEQVIALRDIFGNPFRLVPPDPSWPTADIRALARAAYSARILPAGTLDPVRLAVLADALEDAGCTDADVLWHLRGENPHVRGCWVIDLLLGKR